MIPDDQLLPHVDEIVPFLLEPMIEAIAARMALKAGTGRKISKVHKEAITMEYRSAIKTAHDNLSSMQGRFGKFFDSETVDNLFTTAPVSTPVQPPFA